MTNSSTEPTDWQQVRLEEISKISSGGTPLRSNVSYWGGDIPWVTTAEINSNTIMCSKEHISKEGLKNSSAKLFEKGTLLLAMYGQGKTRGKVAKLGVIATTNQACCAIKVNEPNSENYYYYYILSQYENIRNLSNAGGQKNLSSTIVKMLKVPLPTLPEQHRIVAVLETWYKAIELLNGKIQLKKNIKKGLMQKLLTGGLRLPGFSGEWRGHEVGEILGYEQPTKHIVSHTEYSHEYDTPVLTAGKSFILGYTDELTGICENLPVIIFDDFTTANKFVDFKFKVKSSAMKLLRSKNDKKFNLRFVYERMQIINFIIGEHKRKYLSEYQYLIVKIPFIVEQTAIAEVLTTADDEIEALQKKKQLLENQKTFLLNNLVTGKIRTPENMNI